MSKKSLRTFPLRQAQTAAAQAERLFDRFYTVETARDSTGLGLSIAKLLTEKMGGTIAAEYAGGRLQLSVSFP